MEIVRVLGAAPTAPAEARRSLGPLGESIPSDLLEDVRLVVSELVTNSVLHAGLRDGEPITMRVLVSPHRVRVEVVDRGHGFTEGSEGPAPDHGRGLPIVKWLADRWGTERGLVTKVWAEISLRAWSGPEPRISQS